MLTIRLSRQGRNKQPFYRVVLTEHTKPAKSGYQKVLGRYDPLKDTSEFDVEAIKEWISKSAKPSERVAKILFAETKDELFKKYFVYRTRTAKKKKGGDEPEEAKQEAKEEGREVKKQERKAREAEVKQEQEEKYLEEQKEEKKEDKKPRCAAATKNGGRCKGTPVDGTYCTIHARVEQRTDGKDVQCKKVKSDGKRCGMQTSNKSGLCYYHD